MQNREQISSVQRFNQMNQKIGLIKSINLMKGQFNQRSKHFTYIGSLKSFHEILR